jgi:CO dehydrogenase maturation factor
MGLFHCPFGAIFKDDDPCIDCGLCQARTKQEMAEASRKVKEYLRSTARRSPKTNRIAVCGKGGAGKSTFVTLLANVLRDKGYPVLTIDTDESNPGLSRMLGIDKEPKPLKNLLRRFTNDKPEAGPNFLSKDELSTFDIPAEFIAEDNNFKFMMTGKITEPFEGCACSMADIIRNFLDKLILEEGEHVLVDMEAGIESFGRGVERSVDTVLIIVEPSFESISLAERINYMAQEIGVNTVRAVLTKVPSREVEEKILEKLRNLKIMPIGTIYYDLQVNEDGFEGRSLGESQAKDDVARIAEALMEEN